MEIKNKKKCKNCHQPIHKILRNPKLIGISKFCSEKCYLEGKYKWPTSKKEQSEIKKIYLDEIVYGIGIGEMTPKGIKRVDILNCEFNSKGELKKNKPERDKYYLNWIHQFGCIVCGRSPVQAMHTEHKGMGLKGSDYSILPGCVEHHLGKNGLDTLGKTKFEKLHNVDLKQLQIFYLRKYIVYLKEKK